MLNNDSSYRQDRGGSYLDQMKIPEPNDETFNDRATFNGRVEVDDVDEQVMSNVR